jgi:hypothetical protein
MDPIEFITTENVEMLWEIIEDMNNQQINLQGLREKFIQEVKRHYDKEKKNKIDLMKVNKEFIGIFSQSLKTKPIISQKNNLVTFEEIHEDRISQFEKDLQLKKTDFQESMTLKIPEQPKFNDNSMDKPIKEMEELIAKTLAQRNFEIEQINQTIDKKEVEKWLKGEETSIKEPMKRESIQEPKGREFKYIKIGEPIEKNDLFNIKSTPLPKKSISWNPNLDNNNLDNNLDNNNHDDSIFAKLKSSSISRSSQCI